MSLCRRGNVLCPLGHKYYAVMRQKKNQKNDFQIKLIMLGTRKTFSRRHFEIFSCLFVVVVFFFFFFFFFLLLLLLFLFNLFIYLFIFCFQKKVLLFHANCLLGDNLHEMSRPVF